MRLPATFSSLGNRNYRLYFGGQVVSVTGTWMQQIGQAWLVLELTGSGTLLGLTVALQFLPILVGAPWGGLVADRVDKRALLLWTQSASGLIALTLGVVTATGVVQLWMVMALAFCLGVVNTFDMPTRQSFILEMVGPEHVTNAITLNSMIVNGAKIVGPGVAGVLIATVGIAPSFLVNAVSYIAVLWALTRMRPGDLLRGAPARRRSGQLREGLAYVRRTPDLAAPLLLMGVVGLLAYNFQVALPLLARDVFDGGAQVYGAMTSAMGVGAVLGGLVIAGSLRPSSRTLIRSAAALGVMLLAAALSPTLPLALVFLLLSGTASIAFLTTGNALLQLRTDGAMRGRVMALWTVAFMGTTPLGGPITGWLAEMAGARTALAVGGAAPLVGAAALAWYRHRHPPPEATGGGGAPAAAGRKAVTAP